MFGREGGTGGTGSDLRPGENILRNFPVREVRRRRVLGEGWASGVSGCIESAAGDNRRAGYYVYPGVPEGDCVQLRKSKYAQATG